MLLGLLWLDLRVNYEVPFKAPLIHVVFMSDAVNIRLSRFDGDSYNDLRLHDRWHVRFHLRDPFRPGRNPMFFSSSLFPSDDDRRNHQGLSVDLL